MRYWCALLMLAGTAQASVFYSANGAGNLLTYDTVGNLLFTTPLTGMPTGSSIITLAVQPGTGTVFGDAEAGGGSGSGLGTTDYLVTIDPNSGAVTTVGELLNGATRYNVVTTGMTFLTNGNLYAALYQAGFSVPPGGPPLGLISTADGTITQIGGALDGGLAGDTGLVEYPSVFHQVDSIDVGTGAATLIASTSAAASSQSLTFGPGGALYFLDSSGNLDHFDGSYNVVTGPALSGSPNANILAFAPDSFSPEPASLGLLGAGLAGLVAFRKYWK